MKNKRLLLYCSGIDEIISGSPKVAGIQVQMSFWARTFAKHGWTVYTFTDKNSRDIDGIHFIHKKTAWLEKHKLMVVQEFIDAFHYIIKTKCSLVIARGAQRNLYALQVFCKLLESKLVFFSASDTDFEIGKELIAGSKGNVALYRKALPCCKYFVTQNNYQSTMLFQNYGKKSLILNNIWVADETDREKETFYDAVWVANFRKLKRAEWFIHMAKSLPQYKFALIGGISDSDYYTSMKSEAQSIPNIDFLGAKPFNEVNRFLQRSRLLVCTSEFEGFPNTFLQAWAYGIPVISTVDPSNVISNYGLGFLINNEAELLNATMLMIQNSYFYDNRVVNIGKYFVEHHNADSGYDSIINYVSNY